MGCAGDGVVVVVVPESTVVMADRNLPDGPRTGVDGRLKTNLCVCLSRATDTTRVPNTYIDKYLRKSEKALRQRRREMGTVVMNDGPASTTSRGRAGVETAAGRGGDR